jgi:serine/threonine protein kinase
MASRPVPGTPMHEYAAGFAKVYDFGQHNKSYYMVMDLLGPSLSELFYFSGSRFSLKTTLMIGHQLIERLQYCHERHFIHRDIKPDNILMGLNDESHVLHLVDMGLMKRVIDPETNEHIPHVSDKTLTGTASYASVHAHNGEELSRRDDLESVGYALIYFMNGLLPWQNLNC